MIIMTIQVINGDISINKRVIFENVNLKIMKNCFYRIHGKNGVGKTVLLNTLLGIHPLERGSLSMGYEKKNIVYIPDSNFFFENEKVWDVLNLIKRFYAIPVDKSLSIFKQLTESVIDIKKTYIAELSFGMKKKLMLIPLFIPQIDLLVLDEIFIGIDTDTQNKIINQLVEHYKKGSTIILVEHNEFLVDSIKEKVSVEELICRDGQIKFI